MRNLFVTAVVMMMSVSAFARTAATEVPCHDEAVRLVPGKVKTLAAEVVTIKAELITVGTEPYFYLPGTVTEEERASLDSQGYLVAGDMMWPLSVVVDGETALKHGIPVDPIYKNHVSFAGFLIVRCQTGANASKVEKMWFQRNVEAK